MTLGFSHCCKPFMASVLHSNLEAWHAEGFAIWPIYIYINIHTMYIHTYICISYVYIYISMYRYTHMACASFLFKKKFLTNRLNFTQCHLLFSWSSHVKADSWEVLAGQAGSSQKTPKGASISWAYSKAQGSFLAVQMQELGFQEILAFIGFVPVLGVCHGPFKF